MESFLLVVLHCLLAYHTVDSASLGAPAHISKRHAELVSTLSNYRYTRPYRSTPDGEFISYDLSTSGGSAERSRRSLDEGALDESSSYNFVVQTVSGKDILLNLEKVPDLFSSTFIVEKITENNDVMVEQPSTDCFYQGHVGNEKNSTVVVSSCHGLSGVISVGDEEFIIEPVSPGDESSLTEATDDEGTHIIYRTTDRQGHEEAIDLLRPIDLRNDENELGPVEEILGRLKRSRLPTDRTHYVKTMLVADSSIQDFHGTEATATLYMATLMNIVNKVYAHESLGLNIKFVIVKVVLLNERKSMNIISEDGARVTNLRNANDWAAAQNTEARDPNHFDMTMYFTRLNFGASGYANVGDACRPSFSTALVLDRDGLVSALIAAHEAAHLLGVEHDNMFKSCREDAQSSALMAAFVTTNLHTYYWSSCSKNQLTRKLRSGELDCLEDPPVLDNEDTTYPGLQSTLDEQCRFNYGPRATACPNEDYDPCVILYCLIGPDSTACTAPRRTGRPMEGTPCGDRKWCLQGACQLRDNFAVSEGVFEWHTSEWGPCSITCGGIGLKSREVTCHEVTYDKSGRLENIGDAASKSRCHPEMKPDKKTECSTRACAAEWTTGPWSECDATCGDGQKTRKVTCDIPADTELNYQCWSSKPEKAKPCDLEECPDTGECVPYPGATCKAKNYKRFCMMPGYEEQCCYTCEEQKERLSSWKGKRTRNRT